MTDSKYKAQIKHLKANYVRFRLDLRPEILNEFKSKCNTNNTTPTTEIKKFINSYINENKAED